MLHSLPAPLHTCRAAPMGDRPGHSFVSLYGAQRKPCRMEAPVGMHNRTLQQNRTFAVGVGKRHHTRFQQRSTRARLLCHAREPYGRCCLLPGWCSNRTLLRRLWCCGRSTHGGGLDLVAKPLCTTSVFKNLNRRLCVHSFVGRPRGTIRS